LEIIHYYSESKVQLSQTKYVEYKGWRLVVVRNFKE